MRILVAQVNPLVGDLGGNTEKIIKSLEVAREKKADLVLFSELTICGYPPQDLVFHDCFIDEMERQLERITKFSKGIMVVVGLVRRNRSQGEKQLYNSAAVIIDQQIVGFQDKWLLPTYDVFDERRYFEPGASTRVWDYKGKKIGIVICEDIWQHAGYVQETHYKRDPIFELYKFHPDLLLNLSASPYQFQKGEVRINVCAKAVKTLNCPVVLCCQVGANDQLVFDGYSICMNAKGEVVKLGKGFEEDWIEVDFNHSYPPCPTFERPLQDLLDALILGVRDYFQKCKFKKACMGLSGGIDSALVAYIAVQALGAKNVLGISMPSDYSSKGSVEDAVQLAKNLGIELLSIPIKKPFKEFVLLLEPYFQGKSPDTTEENLQARIRSMILMGISNKLGHIVLSTGNKSEIALGYNTLYGDMCGGLGVIGDVVKTRVYELARWINREKTLIPQPILDKVPSAELRPGQKDTDSLPEYDIVDKVLHGYVEMHLSIDQIVGKYQLPLEVVIDLTRRIHSAEYKRRQGPPVIRVTKKAFGVGRQYPIVQGWM